MSFRQVEGHRRRATGYRRERLGGSLYKGEAISSFFKKMAVRRVDWFDLGDSNEVQGGYGRNHGIQHGFFSHNIPLYGLGLFSGNENLGGGSNMGYSCGSINNGGRTNDNAALPAGLADYYIMSVPTAGSGQFATHWPWYQSDAQSDASNNGIYFDHGAVWDGNAAWSGRYIYALLTAAEGTGQINPNIRLNGAPYTILANGGVLATGGAADYSLTQLLLQVSAGTRDIGLQFRWHSANQQGPVYNLYVTGSMDSRTHGIQYNTMLYRGGQGMIEFAQCVQSGAIGVYHFISFALGGQTAGKETALFCINSGLNDRNDDGQLSVGPVGGLDSATPAGYADNARGVIAEIATAWSNLGFNGDNLYFLLQPSHPISVPDDSELIGYRNVCKQIADEFPNTAVQNLNFPLFANALYQNRTTWYATGGADPNHMTQTGYEEFFKLVTRDLLYTGFNV